MSKPKQDTSSRTEVKNCERLQREIFPMVFTKIPERCTPNNSEIADLIVLLVSAFQDDTVSALADNPKNFVPRKQHAPLPFSKVDFHRNKSVI